MLQDHHRRRPKSEPLSNCPFLWGTFARFRPRSSGGCNGPDRCSRPSATVQGRQAGIRRKAGLAARHEGSGQATYRGVAELRSKTQQVSSRGRPELLFRAFSFVRRALRGAGRRASVKRPVASSRRIGSDQRVNALTVLDRVKAAAIGLGLTLTPLAVMAIAQFVFARQIVMNVSGFNPDIDVWVVSTLRSNLVTSYAVIALIVIAYWLLTAMLGRGQFLETKSANMTLALSGAAFTFTILVASFVREPAAILEGACPSLGISPVLGNSDVYQFGFDTPSPCEAFAVATTNLLLLGLPALLFITSLFQRISLSRRRWPSHFSYPPS